LDEAVDTNMMLTAKPSHIQWLRIVQVMRFKMTARSTNYAGLWLHSPRSNRLRNNVSGNNLVGVKPMLPDSDGLDPVCVPSSPFGCTPIFLCFVGQVVAFPSGDVRTTVAAVFSFLTSPALILMAVAVR
jgi:hypothetical protein